MKPSNANFAYIGDQRLHIVGKTLKIAAIHDEAWLEGQNIDNPDVFIGQVKERQIKADIFTFAQKIPECRPKYNYFFEWDNVAAIPILTYEEWWDTVSSDMRKDVRRAAKRGVVVRKIEFDDEIVKGVVEINNETPIRQGKHFRHYGKDFDTVKEEYSTYLESSEFIGAFYKDELIGIIKMVYVGELACLMEILSKITHYDKRPTNALIAKAVEICVNKRKTYLTYGRYYYGNKKTSSFVNFKHRCGFERILFPRYYVPLTAKGTIVLRLHLQHGLLGILPAWIIAGAVNLRSHYYTTKSKIYEYKRMQEEQGKDGNISGIHVESKG